MELVETKIIAKRTYKWFFENNYVEEQITPEETVEIEASDFEENKYIVET